MARPKTKTLVLTQLARCLDNPLGHYRTDKLEVSSTKEGYFCIVEHGDLYSNEINIWDMAMDENPIWNVLADILKRHIPKV